MLAIFEHVPILIKTIYFWKTIGDELWNPSNVKKSFWEWFFWFVLLLCYQNAFNWGMKYWCRSQMIEFVKCFGWRTVQSHCLLKINHLKGRVSKDFITPPSKITKGFLKTTFLWLVTTLTSHPKMNKKCLHQKFLGMMQRCTSFDRL